MSTETTRPWGSASELRGRAHVLDVPAVDGTPAADIALRRSGLGGSATAPASDTAVFAYPWEHYAAWADELAVPVPEGSFGEQVMTVGLLESEVFLGDTFRWGTATVQVSGPGMSTAEGPTSAMKAADIDSITRTGFSFRVVSPGTVRPEDEMRLIDVDPVGISVAVAARVMADGPAAAGLSVERVLLARHLFPAEWITGWERDGSFEEPSVAG